MKIDLNNLIFVKIQTLTLTIFDDAFVRIALDPRELCLIQSNAKLPQLAVARRDAMDGKRIDKFVGKNDQVSGWLGNLMNGKKRDAIGEFRKAQSQTCAAIGTEFVYRVTSCAENVRIT